MAEPARPVWSYKTHGGKGPHTTTKADEVDQRKKRSSDVYWDIGLLLGAMMWTGIMVNKTLTALFFKGLMEGPMLLITSGWVLTSGLWIYAISGLVARRVNTVGRCDKCR